MARLAAIVALIPVWLTGLPSPAPAAERSKSMDPYLSILPKSPPWEQWAAQHPGDLPDVNALPSCPHLPDPLVLTEGGRTVPITAEAQWRRKREEILALFQQYVIGKVPPPPDNVRAVVLGAKQERGATVQEIRLEFGPDRRATLTAELFVPEGKGPFPVFLTQHNHRPWAQIALARGYLACVYAGADSKDDTEGFKPVYPDYDWSKITRRAWAAGRCIDYLQTLPQVDRGKIALTGHSRNGKLSLIAAALDERITAVISSSSGAGGAMPYRSFSEAEFGEGIELLTRVFPDWFHPRLRCFAGREDRLPVDSHELIALIAPRACLLAIAMNDNVESTWGMQQVYLSAQRVYRLLGQEDRLRIHWRHGTHETRAEEIETYLDWCDNAFARRKVEFRERLIQPYTFAGWKAAAGEKVDAARFPAHERMDVLAGAGGNRVGTAAEWSARREEIRKQITWLLGEAPPAVSNPGGAYGSEYPYAAHMLGRGGQAPEGVEKHSLNFAEYVAADVYAPAGTLKAGRKLPVILWLHPVSCSNGYVAGYRRGTPIHLALAKEGFAVFCFDQVGFGRRIEEAEHFYARHGRWSLLGKMVSDARSALDAIANLPFADRQRVYVLGYGLGGMVGLHAAAMDERITGVVSVCGLTPWRQNAPSRNTGGIQRWYESLALLPRLGFFAGAESRIPYDYEDLLGAIAPRPALVVSPRWDREAALPDVTACVAEARRVYELLAAPKRLEQLVPDDYNRYGPEMQAIVNPWLRKTAGLGDQTPTQPSR